MKNKNWLVVHSLIPLLAGCAIYAFFRPEFLIAYKWLQALNIDLDFSSMQTQLLEIKHIIPAWIYFSLPDGLWAYAFASAMIIHEGNNPKKLRIWLGITIVMVLLIEISQAFNVIQGTFDPWDLIFYLIGIYLSVIIVGKKIRHE
jgi:hypothetical protein